MACDHTLAESWWEHDARGIPIGRVCPKCIDAKLRSFRRDVLYDPNYGSDEPVEPDDVYGAPWGDI